jgi:preprotein translocase subunit SecD
VNFPRWKYFLLIGLFLISLIYALPNLYGEDPAVQLSGLQGNKVTLETVEQVKALLKEANIAAKSIAIAQEGTLLVRFSATETQLKAKEVIKQGLKEKYSVALNLAPATPHWLQVLGARPMKLGLDLRGGVHFLMEADIDSVVTRRLESYYREIPKTLREGKIRFSKIARANVDSLKITFAKKEERNQALTLLQKSGMELTFVTEDKEGESLLLGELSLASLKTIRNETLDQTLLTLRNRVNELGIAEALVQRHGNNRIVVELPGIQDTAYARDILGKTATLKFLMEDSEHPIQGILNGHPVIGSKVYFTREGAPVLLKTQPILTGEAINSASTGQDRDGRPVVNIRLGGDISLFLKTTLENIKKRMAVVYVEIKEGKPVESVISLATIQGPLGSQFQITGFSAVEAREVALLLRAGALPVTLSIIEESIVGPSMGQENITKGIISVVVGLGLVLIFMALYYSVFGIIADIALFANLVLLLALMSLIGATLTLPGIAGIVLTLGMAVDANVLIFERIREELRLGMSPQSSIHRGYEYAFATILDSNLTTLIVGVILFVIGTGPIKGFAVTLCIGILTSLLTAITGSRAIVQLLYGKRSLKRLSVGV